MTTRPSSTYGFTGSSLRLLGRLVQVGTGKATSDTEEEHGRHGKGPALVAGRHPVPDLRPFVARYRRRWVRRPARRDRRPGLPGVAGGGRDLVVADDAFSRRGLG